jgi:tRNA(adenine34) deaminase
MCAGALLMARVSELVFAACDVRGGAAGSVVDLLQAQDFNHRVAVRSGLLGDEARSLMRAFFRPKREGQTADS